MMGKPNRKLALDYAIALGDLNVRNGDGSRASTEDLLAAARKIEAYLNEQ